MKFTLMNTDGTARRGEIETPRGIIRTPAFMPVGTAATVKAMYPDQVRELGADIVLGNTYHLMLRPGAEEVAALGGLQDFMQWNGPVPLHEILKPCLLYTSPSPRDQRGSRMPSSLVALSINRNEVVPTQTMRPPFSLTLFKAAAVSGVTWPHSPCILCFSIFSTLTGKNVPGPTCSVTS